MTQQSGQPILFTMRIKTAKWENLKKANDEVLAEVMDKAREFGLISSKVYRSEADPNDVLFVMEWRSHEDMHRFGDEVGDKFNQVAGAKPEDWEDMAWGLSDARSF